MGKRTIDQDGGHKASKKASDDKPQQDIEEKPELGPEGEMEGISGDEYSDEEIVELDDEDDEEMEADDEQAFEKSKAKAAQQVEAEENLQKVAPQVYLPHKSRPLGPDEVMEADPSVYEMLHNINIPWPCLTLDILPDSLGSERRGYPSTMYLATATQADKAKENELIVMKLSSLSKTLEREDEDDEEDIDEDEDDGKDPVLESELVPLKSTTNRLRVNPLAQKTGKYWTAAMEENGEMYLFDLSAQYKAFDTPGYMIPSEYKRPGQIVKVHGNVEGYGLDWSPVISEGAVLSGDVAGRIYLTKNAGSKWLTDREVFQTSSASIEDIQWSRSEQTVFATAGTDGRISIWDTRSKKHKPALHVQASTTDVNVISWCDKIDYLLASGHDDGTWGVWDLRSFKPNNTPSPVVSYDFHKSPITSIAFNPLDESVVAVSSEDNTVTLWDLAVEADDEEISQQRAANPELSDIPPQLLFVHWQKDVKDVRWHKQIPGTLVSTGTDGLNVWKTISV